MMSMPLQSIANSTIVKTGSGTPQGVPLFLTRKTVSSFQPSTGQRGISERSCLAPTLVDRHPGSAQGTTPTVLRPLFVLTSFLEFAPMGLAPVPTNENCPLKSLGRLKKYAIIKEL